VMVEKGAPRLRWRPSLAGHVLRDLGLRHFDSEFEQFPMDPQCPSQRVRPTHSADQVPDLRVNLRTARFAVSTLPCPIEPESVSVPSDDCFRLDHQQRRTPARPEAGEPYSKQPVRRVQTRAALLRSLEYGQLMAQGKNFNLQSYPSSKPGTEAEEYGQN
jgi:hypothetical protein